MLYDYRIGMSYHMLYDCDVDNRTVKCHFGYCITFDFRIRREGCKITVSYYVSGHRGHRHCYELAPPSLEDLTPLAVSGLVDSSNEV